MSTPLDLLLPGLAAAFLLTFARVGTLMMLMPGLGEQLISARLRLGLALLVTLVLFPAVRPNLPTGAGASAVIVSPRTGRLYVANRDDATVTALDPATGTVIATMEVDSSPLVMAIDAERGRLYVTNNNASSVSVIEE